MGISYNFDAEALEDKTVEISVLTESLEAAMEICPTAQPVLEVMKKVQESNNMTDLFAAMNAEDATVEEVKALADNLGRALKNQNIMAGFKKFSDYLQAVIDNPVYELRKDYYSDVKQHTDELMAQDFWNDYENNYKIFLEDQSNDAKVVRFIFDELTAAQKDFADTVTSQNA